jgi:hypothetical protein
MQSRSRVILFAAAICVIVTVKHLQQPIPLKSSSSARGAAKTVETKKVIEEDDVKDRPSCLRAMDREIPKSQYGSLPKPYINLGMPKMGSTSLQAFFKCGGFNSSHYECGNEFCADCIHRAVSHGQPPLSSCGSHYDAFVQLDNGSFFPQIEYLDEIHREHPNATFLLTFRGMAGWYRSISHWPPNADVINPPLVMSNRMKSANITGLPVGMGRNAGEFTMWFCNHVNNVRQFVKRYPSHGLIELDIEGEGNGKRLGELFGIRSSCWGHANKNPGLGGDKKL